MNSRHNGLEEICFTRFEGKLCPQVNNNVFFLNILRNVSFNVMYWNYYSNILKLSITTGAQE